MQIEILAIGRARAGPERALYQTYAERIRWPLVLRELEEKRRLPPAEMTAREGALLLDALPGDAAAIVLDETGKELSSEQFAKQLGRWRDDGRATIAFVIGGADGVAGEVRDRADLVLSLGRQTWPHMLVRAMLAEQIYRAQQILAGHPYHRG
jgi:23S rRNA (pseudouridine1915-N3)-methyltransferase